ncbi:MAG: hypothetical protein A3E87_05480 [Gammaproteobacteria bacterium RIFCSPHIGHO2_12_FULL_35_23]|nr:MAG: hypothetical protein A3E87_05480 [Gammaproteobacteria bacterium RIFCSPHIGHO2_12_FULL_35_23]
MNYSEFLPKSEILFTKSEKKLSKLPWQIKSIAGDASVINSKEFLASPHKWFNTTLRLNEICDLEQIKVPGAMVILPWGVKIIEKFAAKVRKEAVENGYNEYSYPSLIPSSYFDAMSDLMDVKNSVLNVSSQQKKESHDLALTPTGEYPIYDHWRTIIKTKNDLPKKIFQRTKYFRPISSAKRSGGSVFLSMEAGDVFEFHSCFSEVNSATTEALKLLAMFKKIANDLGTFVLWSLRPTWTNNGYLYRWSYGGDAILPSKNTVQVSCSYFQDDIFSRRFNIAYSDNSIKLFTHQATGAITKRLVFANLFQSIRSDRSLCLHPDISPIQVVFLLTVYNSDDELIFEKIKDDLVLHGIQSELIRINSKSQFHQEEKKWYQRGVPLRVLIFGRKNHEKIKATMIRNDTGEELQFNYEQYEMLIKLAIKDIIASRSINHYQNNIVFCKNISELENVLEAKLVAFFPLSMQSQNVYEVEKLYKGEVLGFIAADEMMSCLISGEKVFTRAFVSRRI